MNQLAIKYLVKTITTISIFILIISCTNGQKSNDKSIKLICNKYNFLPSDNWEIVEQIATNCDLDLAMLRNQSDTSIYLSAYISYINCTQDSVFILLKDYIKIYNCNSKKCFMAFDETNSPIYQYFLFDENKDSIIFDFGKYRYLYDKDYLNRRQRLYYEQNKDSLERIRGNSIPDLPEIK